MQRVPAAVPVILSLILAGCLGLAPGSEEAGSAEAAPGEARLRWSILDAVPPGCDASRPAIAHLEGGVAATFNGPLPIPCLSATGMRSFEPTLGVSRSTGAVFLFPAIPIGGNVYPGGVGLARSVDEGATWTILHPATAGVSPHVVDFDPYFYLDPVTGRLFVDNLATINCSVFSWSDDEGATWEHSVSGCLETDHQTIFAGRPTTSVTVGYPNVVYRCAMNTVAFSGGSTTSTCQRSLDGGRTWLPPGSPAFVTIRDDLTGYCDGAVGHGRVDGAGRIYLPKGLCGEPWLAMSDDEGLTWTRIRVSDLGMNRNSDGYPGHDAGVGIDADGNVYYFWIAEDRLPYLAISRDRGATWGTPRMVGVPGLTESTFPALAVADVGKVAFLYLGSTNSPGAPFPHSACDDLVCIGSPPQPNGYEHVTWNGYLGMTVDALADDPVFLTASVSDPADPLVRGACGAGRCQNVYDFLGMDIGLDGTPWGAFVDTCVETCLTDSRTQNNAADGFVGRLWGGPSLAPESGRLNAP